MRKEMFGLGPFSFYNSKDSFSERFHLFELGNILNGKRYLPPPLGEAERGSGK